MAQLGTTTADGSGNWSVSGVSLMAGAQTVTLVANGASVISRSFTVTAGDTTAPSVGTLTVPAGTAGTAMTTINPGTSTDAAGIVGWMIKDAATDSFTAPVAGDSGWTAITYTTSWAPGAALSYTPATAGAPRYFRLYCKDSAGNVGASATASATVASATPSVPLFNPSFDSALLGAQGDGWWPDHSFVGTTGSIESASFIRETTSPIYSGNWGHLIAQPGGVDVYDPDTDSDNWILNCTTYSKANNRTTKSDIVASSGLLKFKARLFSMSGGGGDEFALNCIAVDSGGGWLGTVSFVLWGAGTGNTSYRITPTAGTNYDFAIDVKGALSAQSWWGSVNRVLWSFIAVGAGGVNDITAHELGIDYFDAR